MLVHVYGFLEIIYDMILVSSYNESEPLVELYPFQECFPGFFGINCQMRCHCDLSCECDPIVGCISCDEGRGCHLLYQGFPVCQGKSINEIINKHLSRNRQVFFRALNCSQVKLKYRLYFGL